MVPTDGTVVHGNIPGPECHCSPLLDLKLLLLLIHVHVHVPLATYRVAAIPAVVSWWHSSALHVDVHLIHFTHPCLVYLSRCPGGIALELFGIFSGVLFLYTGSKVRDHAARPHKTQICKARIETRPNQTRPDQSANGLKVDSTLQSVSRKAHSTAQKSS